MLTAEFYVKTINLTIWLKQLLCLIPCIAVSETWTTLLTEIETFLIHLPDYNCSKIRKIKTGVGIYFAENITTELTWFFSQL